MKKCKREEKKGSLDKRKLGIPSKERNGEQYRKPETVKPVGRR